MKELWSVKIMIGDLLLEEFDIECTQEEIQELARKHYAEGKEVRIMNVSLMRDMFQDMVNARITYLKNVASVMYGINNPCKN